MSEADRTRLLPFPWPETVLMPGETKSIQVLVQNTHWTKHLVVADDCLGCVIEELRVGTVSIMREVLPCSAAAFMGDISTLCGPSEEVREIRILRSRVDELLPKQSFAFAGLVMTLRVRNASDTPVTFRACSYCPQARLLTLPWPETAIAPGEAMNVRVQPCGARWYGYFVTERLLVAPNCSECVVEELWVSNDEAGEKSILREVLPCAATVFFEASAPRHTDPEAVAKSEHPWRIATLLREQSVTHQSGHDMTLRVRNVGEKTVNFRASSFGYLLP